MSPRLIRLLLAPLIAWTVHFFGGYGLALALPTSAWLDPLIVALTVAMLGALWLVWRRTAPLETHRLIARQATIIAGLAIFWQGLVILF